MKTLKRCLIVAALLLAGSASAEMTMPQTAEDHLKLAQSYRDKAATYKKEAQEHRDMAEMYKQSIAPGGKSGPNPWAKKMEAHCMKIVKNAEAMAADAEFAAKIHELRAKELQETAKPGKK